MVQNLVGCLKIEKIHHMFAAITKYDNPSDRTAKAVYKEYYNDGDISFEEFKDLSQKNCFYCNLEPSNKTNHAKNDPKALKERAHLYDFIYSGLDRIDSSRAHFKDNVVPCCRWCNFAKQDLSFDYFKEHLSNIIKFRKLNYNNSFLNIKVPSIIPTQIEVRQPANKVLAANVGDKLGKLTILEFIKNKCNVKCECGKEKIVIKHDLFSGKTRSCNGGDCRGKTSPYISTAKAAWASHYKEIKIEEFLTLSQMNCFYCNSAPKNKITSIRSSKKEIDNYSYNGLDRLDSNKTHTIDNVMPCCSICNTMKNNMSLSKFNDWVSNIETHFINKKDNEKYDITSKSDSL